MTRTKLALVCCLLFVGCTKSQDTTLRSPSLDYEPPPPESAADGQPVGADRVAPGDKLDQGVSTAGPAPGWSADKSGPAYDPKKRVGGAVDPPPERGASQK
ncbi:MAG TPA: hypothetical protein VGM44_21380 [Polyangiaceae bacterium]|jgi:hypothetical protein